MRVADNRDNLNNLPVARKPKAVATHRVEVPGRTYCSVTLKHVPSPLLPPAPVDP